MDDKRVSPYFSKDQTIYKTNVIVKNISSKLSQLHEFMNLNLYKDLDSKVKKYFNEKTLFKIRYQWNFSLHPLKPPALSILQEQLLNKTNKAAEKVIMFNYFFKGKKQN